jgi:hypothetical protein
MSLQNLDDVSAFLKAHLDEEAQSGFPRLTRIPSTGIIQFLDYFGTLTAADRDALLAALAHIDALNLFPPPVVRERVETLVTTNSAFVSYRQASSASVWCKDSR